MKLKKTILNNFVFLSTDFFAFNLKDSGHQDSKNIHFGEKIIGGNGDILIDDSQGYSTGRRKS